MEGMASSRTDNITEEYLQPSTSQVGPINRSIQTKFDHNNKSCQSQPDILGGDNRVSQQDDHGNLNARQQNIYRQKCILLEPHIQEAVLINKALRSELKQYRDKIKFEKNLCKYLVTKVKDIDS